MSARHRPVLLLLGALFGSLLGIGPAAARAPFLEIHSTQPYAQVSAALQAALLEQDWRIRFVQPVEEGLARRGHAVGTFRVFLVEPPDADRLARIDPRLVALLPLRITVYARDTGLGIVAQRPGLTTTTEEAAAGLLADWDDALEHILAQTAEALAF